MDSAEVFSGQLDREYAELARTVSEYDGRIITVKGWSVTVSIAALGLGFQQGHAALFLLAALTGLAFWAIEAMVKRHQVRYYPRMRQIEAWRARTSDVSIDDAVASSPRIDWAWTMAGRPDAAAALRQPPVEMTSAQIVRMRRHVAWLPHVFMPSAIAVVVGLLLAGLVSGGVLDLPW